MAIGDEARELTGRRIGAAAAVECCADVVASACCWSNRDDVRRTKLEYTIFNCLYGNWSRTDCWPIDIDVWIVLSQQLSWYCSVVVHKNAISCRSMVGSVCSG